MTPANADTDTTTTPDAPTRPIPLPAPPPGGPPTTPTVDTTPDAVDDLPEWARRELAAARGDAAKYRTRARDTATEAETLTARVAELETARQEDQARVIAARHGISDEDAALFFPKNATTEQLERIADALGQRRQGAVIPREGTGAATRAGTDPLAAFAKSLFTTDL